MSLISLTFAGDSLLNLFRDHNFDSCAVCVCSDGQNWVGTIRGPDALFYLPDNTTSTNSSSSTISSSANGSSTGNSRSSGRSLAPPPPPAAAANQYGALGAGFTLPSANQEEENCRCNCGFSAIVNRRMAHQAGLFYEDEVEIAGAGSTQDPAQFKRGSLYAVCHSDKDEQQVLMRSRLLDLIQGVSVDKKRHKEIGEKDPDKSDMVIY